MTEKEKMILGLTYDAGVDELLHDRDTAKDLCFRFNHTQPSKREEQLQTLQELFHTNSTTLSIEAPFYCDYGYNIHLGESVFINHHCTILDCCPVTIGNHVFIGPNVGIYTAFHPVTAKERNAGVEQASPITIEDDCWIGGNVAILPGITIGKGSVIGTGSIVTKNIPPNSLAVGNPCKVIKQINNEE